MDMPHFDSGALPMRPVRRGNAFEETVERVLENLKLGIYAAGSRLPPERELAARLGVSRATLREALAELQAAGYLEARRGRYGGTFAAEVLPERSVPSDQGDAGGLEDVLLFRRVVESAAARLAAEATLTPAARGHLLAALEEVDHAATDTFRPKDARFHIAVAELSGSSRLVAAVAEVRAQASDLLDRIPLLQANLDHSQAQHRELVNAVLRGDADAAEAAAVAHLEGTERLLRGFLG